MIEKIFQHPLIIFLSPIALLWARSSIDKIIKGVFPQILAPTLEKFASNNPYPWYKDILLNVAIPNAATFGTLIMWAEFTVAVALIVALTTMLLKGIGQKPMQFLLLAGLLGGFTLNLLFWLASGWLSPSSDGLNLLMMITQGIGIYYTYKLLTT